MARYFEQFPIISYLDNNVYDITRRTAILSRVFGDNYAFYPYRVKNGMRAERIAELYYGDPDFVWLVYMSNNIIDPYHQWPMSEETFKNYMIDKYGPTMGQNTILSYRVNWYEDTRKLSQIQFNSLLPNQKKYWTPEFDNNNNPMFYVRKEMEYSAVKKDGNGNVTLNVPIDEVQYWAAVTAFDIEEEENAKKANIRLLDSRFAQTAAANLRKLMSE
jgi:hypothetical protein